MGPILSLYVANAFVRSILGIFAGVAALIFLIDLLELFRRSSDLPDVPTSVVTLTALFRLPSLGEQMLPFAVLFGSMAALLSLSRKLELVVARAAGVSAWQFLGPGLLVTVGLGLFTTGVYNPVAILLKNEADKLEAEIFKRQISRDTNLWLRQSGDSGQSVMHAAKAHDEGKRLTNVSVFVYDAQGRFRERVEAAEAQLDGGFWTLTDAVVSAPQTERKLHPAYRISTYLTEDQVRESLSIASNASFWDLPGHIALADRAGLPSTRFRLQFQTLLATPLLFVAMALLAACVSMRLFRLGSVGKMILIGVISGFGLYVATKIAQDLGAGGFVSAAAAAWAPPGVAALLGVTALLHQEDG